MTADPTEKLRKLALSVTQGDLRRPWSVQTSNSFRRIGTDRGDGDVLCAVTQPTDRQPDLHAAPDVLDYIVAAHPFVILQLIRERDSARHALHCLQHKITEHAVENGTPAHPPIASYALGARVTFHPGRGDRWYPGIVTRLESGLRADGSAWHTIFVSSTRDLPDGEREHAVAYRFEDLDDTRVKPALQGNQAQPGKNALSETGIR